VPLSAAVTHSRESRSSVQVSSLLFFLSGSVLNVAAYDSAEPFLASVVFFATGTAILTLTQLGGRLERRMFNRVFGIGWLMAGVAALYANYLNDPFQGFSDPAWFFNLSSGAGPVRSLQELGSISEGAGAIVLWRWIYNAFSALGFERGRYLGVLVNVLSVSLAGVVAVKIAFLTYGKDESRINRLIALFSMCGLFWLFAAIHLRDGVVLLAVTTLAYYWVQYLARPGARSVASLLIATVIGFAVFVFLRTQFLFVPLAMLMAGLSVSLIYDKTRGTRRLLTYLAAFGGVAVAAILYVRFQDRIFASLVAGYSSYLTMSTAAASANSLGMSLIINQPLPIRIILGSAYLYVYPIPFWAGFQLESAYQLFKSFNAIFFYALIPMLSVALWKIGRQKNVRTPPLMFLLFLGVGFTLAVAGTSGETRHLGAFLVPVFVVALLPDLENGKDRHIYKKHAVVFITMVLLLHISWFVIKL
jgi:hypothetical protein